jgi:hypothetical protein
MKTSNFPSLREYSGYYNVDRAQHGENALDPSMYHCTVDKPPSLEWHEFEEVREDSNKCLRKEGLACGIEERCLRDGFAWGVEEKADDRTVTLDVEDLRLLTANTVKALQTKVLGNRPLWRILVHGESPTSVILIYPTLIRVGDRDPSSPLEPAIVGAVEEIARACEAREGSKRRQLAHLRAEIPPLLVKGIELKPQVVAVFDRGYRGDPEALTLWLLLEGDNPLTYEIVKPKAEPNAGIGSGSALIVRANGYCDEYYEASKGLREGERWLEPWYVPKGTEYVVIEGPFEWGVEHQRCTFRIDPDGIVKDAELERLYPFRLPPQCHVHET